MVLNYSNYGTRYDAERQEEIFTRLAEKAEGCSHTCCVPGCSACATHEVMLYDYYAYLPPRSRTYLERDETCPYLCDEHLAENEREAVGWREPRGYVKYPYTNQRGAQGYTKYRKLRSRHG